MCVFTILFLALGLLGESETWELVEYSWGILIRTLNGVRSIYNQTYRVYNPVYSVLWAFTIKGPANVFASILTPTIDTAECAAFRVGSWFILYASTLLDIQYDQNHTIICPRTRFEMYNVLLGMHVQPASPPSPDYPRVRVWITRAQTRFFTRSRSLENAGYSIGLLFCLAI